MRRTGLKAVTLAETQQPRGDAAALAAAVLDEEAARQEAQARLLRAGDLPRRPAAGRQLRARHLPRGASRSGGRLMFIVLGLLLAFDELEGAAIQVLGPNIRNTFHISSGAIVFIGTASSAFFVLGAVPMGWLADRVQPGAHRRHRQPLLLVLRRSRRASRSTRSCCSGPGSRPGIAKSNSIPVHQSLIADNYPIGIRARMSAVMNMGAHGIGLCSPVLVAAIATWAGGPEGWRWAWYLLGIPVVDRRDRGLQDEGAAPRPVREGRRPRRGDRGRGTRPRSRWSRRSPASRRSRRSGPCSSPSAPSASASSARASSPRST